MWHCRSDVTCQQLPLHAPRSICAAAHPAYDCILPFEEGGRTYYKCGVEFEEGGRRMNWCPVKTLAGKDAIKTCESGQAFSYQQLKYNSGGFGRILPVNYTETVGCANIGESNVGESNIGKNQILVVAEDVQILVSQDLSLPR